MVTPFITFNGDCMNALDFYQKVFGTEIKMSMPYGDYVPEGITVSPPNLKNWILHAQMQICGTEFWFADEAAEPAIKGSMVKLTVQVLTAKEAQRIFDALRAGADISLPPTETFLQQVPRRSNRQIWGGLEYRRLGKPQSRIGIVIL